MRKSRFSEAQIIGMIKEQEAERSQTRADAVFVRDRTEFSERTDVANV